MNRDGMTGLLAALLESQIESGKFGEIDKNRIRQALTTGPTLTEQEQRLLLLSPVARSDYKEIRREIVIRDRQRLDRHGVETNLMPLAASDDSDKVVLKSSGFTVTLYRQEKLGVPWVILVQLGPAYQKAVNPMTTLRLADTGGLEWLRGKPDTNGEITGAWNDPETDLIKRIRRFSLMLEPV